MDEINCTLGNNHTSANGSYVPPCPPHQGDNIPLEILEIVLIVMAFVAPVLLCCVAMRCYEMLSMRRAQQVGERCDSVYVRQSCVEHDTGPRGSPSQSQNQECLFTSVCV